MCIFCRVPLCSAKEFVNLRQDAGASDRWPEVLIPVSFFPDIQQMPVKEREKWMVLDDQYFTFENMTRVYSVLDLLKVA